MWPDGGCQHHALKGLTAAECNIDLTVGKGISGINDRPLKGQPLALVDGDGPGRFQGVLDKGTDLFFCYIMGLFINRVPDIFPGRRFHLDLAGITRTANHDPFIINISYLADLAVKIFFVFRWIVTQKHHLCANLEFEQTRCRIAMFRKFALSLGLKTMALCTQLPELGIIQGINFAVMSGKGDPSLFIRWFKPAFIPAVELFQSGRIKPVLPYPVKQPDKAAVRLPIDML